MISRFAIVVALGLVLTACGQTRNEDLATSSPEEVAAALDGEVDLDAQSEQAPADSTPPPTAPPLATVPLTPATTAPAADVAVTINFADGSSTELLHGPLNEIVGPTGDDAQFVTLVFQGVFPPDFNALVLNQSVVREVMDNELAKLGVEPSADDVGQAEEAMLAQLQAMVATGAAADTDPVAESERLYQDVPYVPFIAGLQARQTALAAALADAAGDDTGNPCVRHILVTEEEAAIALVADLEGGADFATLATEQSIDTGSGALGGDLGCNPSATYVPEFAEAVDNAERDAIVGPVQSQFGFHVIVVYDYAPADGNQLAEQVITDGLRGATVTVDERVGIWDPSRLAIVPAG